MHHVYVINELRHLERMLRELSSGAEIPSMPLAYWRRRVAGIPRQLVPLSEELRMARIEAMLEKIERKV